MFLPSELRPESGNCSDDDMCQMMFIGRGGRYHWQYVPLVLCPPPPPALPCLLCVEPTKGHVRGKLNQPTSVSVSVSTLARGQYLCPWRRQSLNLILPKRCLPNATLGSSHLSRDGPVIRCTPARIGPDVQMGAAQCCIASGAALEPAYALVGTAQSRQIDQGPRRKRRDPSRSICRRPLPEPLHPV